MVRRIGSGRIEAHGMEGSPGIVSRTRAKKGYGMLKDVNHPGPQIEAIREAKGWTRYRLAKEAGLSESILSRCESGKRTVSWDTACRLADALGVKLDRLRA